MDHPEGAGLQRADRVDFDPRVRLEFCGTQLSSDGGLLVMRELDDTLGLSDLASAALRDTRRGKNAVHRLDGLFRQSVYGRLAGYEDVNDADRLATDPVMRQVVGGRAVDAQAASASQMGRFETETLALPENRTALAELNGQWIDRFHDRNGLKYTQKVLCSMLLTQENVMKTLVVFAALMIVGASAIASQSTPVTPSSKFSEIIRNNKNTDHIIQASVTCFKTGEQASGMNKICYYNCLGSTAAITISSVSLCPLSINR